MHPSTTAKAPESPHAQRHTTERPHKEGYSPSFAPNSCSALGFPNACVVRGRSYVDVRTVPTCGVPTTAVHVIRKPSTSTSTVKHSTKHARRNMRGTSSPLNVMGEKRGQVALLQGIATVSRHITNLDTIKFMKHSSCGRSPCPSLGVCSGVRPHGPPGRAASTRSAPSM